MPTAAAPAPTNIATATTTNKDTINVNKAVKQKSEDNKGSALAFDEVVLFAVAGSRNLFLVLDANVTQKVTT